MQLRGISERSLCKSADVSPTFLRPYLNGTAKRGFPLEIADRFAKSLDCSVHEFLQDGPAFEVSVEDQARDAINRHAERLANDLLRITETRLRHRGFPKVQDVIAWLRLNGGRIDEQSDLYQYYDLHMVPDATSKYLSTEKVGKFSLAGLRLGAEDPEVLRNMMRSLPEEQMGEILMSYRKADETGLLITNQSISVDLPQHEIQFEQEYICLRYPVRTADLRKFVLCFTEPIEPSV